MTTVLFMHYMHLGSTLSEYKAFAEGTVTQPKIVAATVAATGRLSDCDLR